MLPYAFLQPSRSPRLRSENRRPQSAGDFFFPLFWQKKSSSDTRPLRAAQGLRCRLPLFHRKKALESSSVSGSRFASSPSLLCFPHRRQNPTPRSGFAKRSSSAAGADNPFDPASLYSPLLYSPLDAFHGNALHDLFL